MNKKKIAYFPVCLYSLLLVVIWVASWISGIVGLLSSGVQRNGPLLSVSGVRWALRTAVDSLEAAPWGSMALCVAALGLLYGSGFVETVSLLFTRKTLSHNRRSALVMSFVLLLMWIVILLLCSVAPWHILAGVTMDFSSSPLVVGWQPLMFVVVLSIAVMHGAVSGYYRSCLDVLDGVCRTFNYFLPAFIAVIPASGVVPCLVFAGVLPSDGMLLGALGLLLYLLPFILLLLSCVSSFCCDSLPKD